MTDEQLAVIGRFDAFAGNNGATERTHHLVDDKGMVVCRYTIQRPNPPEVTVYCTFLQESATEYRIFITSGATESFKLADDTNKRVASDLIMRHMQKLLRLIGRDAGGVVVFDPEVAIT